MGTDGYRCQGALAETGAAMQFYTLQDLSEMLHLSMTTIYRYVQNGTLKATKIGNSYRLTDEDLRNFMNQARVATNARRTLGSIGAVVGVSSIALGAAAFLAARKAGSKASADASPGTPAERSASDSQTASAGKRSGIPRFTPGNGELRMAEAADFEEPPAAAGLAVSGIVGDVFGKITEYTPLPRRQALITVKKISFAGKDEAEEAHSVFCEALDGTGWKLDSMLVTDPKYRKLGMPQNVLIYLTYTGIKD